MPLVMANHRSSSHPHGAAYVDLVTPNSHTGDLFRQPITGTPGGTQNLHGRSPRRHSQPQDLHPFFRLCVFSAPRPYLAYFFGILVTSPSIDQGPGSTARLNQAPAGDSSLSEGH